MCFPTDLVWCILGHVGAPVTCNYVKLEDVADMNYFSANNEGEVSQSCLGSWIVTVGYSDEHIVSILGFPSFEIFSKGSPIS